LLISRIHRRRIYILCALLIFYAGRSRCLFCSSHCHRHLFFHSIHFQSSKMHPSPVFTFFLLNAIPIVSAWGTLGHDTVALIAQNFVTAKTKTYTQKILNDSTATYLANVATWADSYRSTAAGKFSAPFHYIDAEDDPPHSCGVDFQRDCGSGGCVVSAIANYVRFGI
jgi:hypothetical protein